MDTTNDLIRELMQYRSNLAHRRHAAAVSTWITGAIAFLFCALALATCTNVAA